MEFFTQVNEYINFVHSIWLFTNSLSLLVDHSFHWPFSMCVDKSVHSSFRFLVLPLCRQYSFVPLSVQLSLHKSVCLYLSILSLHFIYWLFISFWPNYLIFSGRKTDVWYAIDLDTGIKQQTLKLDGTETVCPMMSNKKAPVFLGRTGTLIDLHIISPGCMNKLSSRQVRRIY